PDAGSVRSHVRDQHARRRRGDAGHIVVLGVPHAPVAEFLGTSGKGDTVREAFGDTLIPTHCGEVEDGQGQRHQQAFPLRHHSVEHAVFPLGQPAERAEYFHRPPTVAEDTAPSADRPRDDRWTHYASAGPRSASVWHRKSTSHRCAGLRARSGRAYNAISSRSSEIGSRTNRIGWLAAYTRPACSGTTATSSESCTRYGSTENSVICTATRSRRSRSRNASLGPRCPDGPSTSTWRSAPNCAALSSWPVTRGWSSATIARYPSPNSGIRRIWGAERNGVATNASSSPRLSCRGEPVVSSS